MEIVKKHVLEVFSLASTTYDRGRRKWYTAIFSLAKQLEYPILDLGCGTGEISVRIASTGKEILALDVAHGMVKAAWRRAKRRNTDAYVNVAQSWAPFLPIRSEAFRGILAAASIHNIPCNEHRVETLKEIQRCLKPKGLALVTVWYRYTPRNFLNVLKCFLRLRKWGDCFLKWGDKGSRFYHFYSVRELKKDAKRAELKNFKVRLWSPNKKIFKNNILLIIKK